jgi:hypothetical protein
VLKNIDVAKDKKSKRNDNEDIDLIKYFALNLEETTNDEIPNSRARLKIAKDG